MRQYFMSDDLWGPCYQEESGSDLESEWLWYLRFNHGLDIIEEDAINERCCVQVLKILIAKEDVEIEELEKELVSLQTELAWAEYEAWSDVCTSFLREKVNCLDVSLRNLKNEDADSIEFYLLMHTEPVSELQDLLKALLESFWQTRDKDVIFLYASSDSPTHDAEVLHRNQKLGISERNTSILEEETEGPSYTPKQKYAFSNTSNELQVRKANGSGSPASSDVKESSMGNLVLAACNHDAKAITDQASTYNEGAKDKTVTSGRKEVVQNVVPKSAPKRIHDQEKYEQKGELVMNSCDEDNFVSHLNKKKRSGGHDLKIVKTEKENFGMIYPEDVITVKPLPELVESTVPLCSDTKLQNMITQGLEFVPGTHKHTADHSTERGKQGKPGLEGQTRATAASCESRTRDLSAICKSNFSKSSSVAEYKKISLKEDKPTNHTMVNGHSPDTVRHRDGLGGRNDHDPNRQEACLDYDMNKKLSDFLSASMHKKPSKSGVIGKGFSNTLWREGGKTKEAHITEGQLVSTEQSALCSLLPQQEEKDKDSTVQLLEQGKPMKVELAESIAPCNNPAVDLQTGKQTEEEKMNAGSNLIAAGESTGRILNPSSVSFTEKYANNLNPVPSLSGKTLDGHSSTSAPQKVSKKDSPMFFKVKSSTFLAELLKLWKRPVDTSGKVAFSLSEFHSDESSMQLMRPALTRDLMNMKVRDLKAIARELNLTGLSKLKKATMVERILNHLSRQVP